MRKVLFQKKLKNIKKYLILHYQMFSLMLFVPPDIVI